MNYYNEFDHNAAEWLRELIAAGLIPAGEVDERSITDVGADDLRGYTQCHFFAGIGGWSLALRLAGWPDDRPIWTGSCPCQCFSAAGKQRGFADDRDLWTVFANLIAKCRPEFVFGEQVENAIKHGWLDRVYADLEAEGYAVGAAVLGAHSVGAPHRRHRLYWGATKLADRDGKLRHGTGWQSGGRGELTDGGGSGRMAENANGGGRGGRHDGDPAGEKREIQAPGLGGDGLISNSPRERRREEGELGDRSPERSADGCDAHGISHTQSDGRLAWRSEPDGRGAASGRLRGGVDDHKSIGRGLCDASNLGPADGKINASANADRRGGGVADDTVVGVPSGVSGQNARKEGGPGELVHDHSNYGLADCGSAGLEGRHGEQRADQLLPRPSGLASLSPWARYRLVYCRDKKIRRIPAESLFLRLADGVSEGVDAGGTCGISEIGGFPLTTKKEGRSMLLKGYGNAIVPQDAAEFVSAFTFCIMK